jgi:hypothetical protein
VRAHLGLLSKLAFALRDERFRGAVARRTTREELLAAAAEVEAQLAQPAPAQSETNPAPIAGMNL